MDHLIIFVLFVGVMVIADMVTRLTWWIVDKMKNSASAVTQAESLRQSTNRKV